MGYVVVVVAAAAAVAAPAAAAAIVAKSLLPTGAPMLLQILDERWHSTCDHRINPVHGRPDTDGRPTRP